MNLNTSIPELRDALAAVVPICRPLANLPTAGMVLMQCESATQTIRLTASDLSISISLAVKAQIDGDAALCLDGKKLLGLLRSFSDTHVALTLQDTSLTITTKGSKTKLVGLPAAEFSDMTVIPTRYSVKLPAAALSKALANTVFCVDKNPASSVFEYVSISFFSDKAEAATTNGHRMVIMASPLTPEKTMPTGPDCSILFLAKAADEAAKLLANDAKLNPGCECNLGWTDAFVLISSHGFRLVARLGEGAFPNYHAILPKTDVGVLEIPRVAFHEAVERCAIFTDSAGGATAAFSITQEGIEISVISEKAEFVESIDAKWSGIDPIRIALNPRLLLDAVSRCTEEHVHIHFAGPLAPVVIREGLFMAVQMPMRLPVK